MPDSKQRGFTLLEVMVALAIMGLGLLVIIQLFSGGLISARVSDDYTSVILHAKERMNDLLTSTELAEGIEEGVTEDGFSWRAEVTPYFIKGIEDVQGLKTYNIKVEVRNPYGSKDITLETLKTEILLMK